MESGSGPTTTGRSGTSSRSAASASHNARRSGSRKHRGLTCANCRAKKIRCEGSQPTCKTCETYREKCRYEKLPPMSQVLAMAKRLQEAEQTIAELRAAGAGGATRRSQSRGSQSPVETSAQPIEIDQLLDQPAVNTSPEENGLEVSSPKEVPPDLSVDQDGKICFYGPTSAVHDPPAMDTPLSRASNQEDATLKAQARALLAAKADEARVWEAFALGRAAIQTDIPREVITKLLNLHWTWISPMFMWVYRPAFIFDMSTGGPNYSEFLLLVLCGHAARFCDIQLAERLISKARILLGNIIHQPASVPTVQALLQLSARDLAYGSISQAWLYSGMAFRMACDLGLHHSTPADLSLEGLSAVDMEVRRRLFWSCYFWDKAISLYTGRMPALTDIPDNASFEFLDDSSESELWSPFCVDSLAMAKLAPGEYPPRKGHYVSCFANSCKLAVIIDNIIISLYSRRAASKFNASLDRIKAKLAAWRAQSPAHLRYDANELPETCPPPHIISQNLLYYASVILTHRPFCSVPMHYEACVSAAKSMEKLLLLIEHTFGFENITYLMAYCVYTGASALLRDARNGNAEAATKVQTFTRALQVGSIKCPLLERSLGIIKKGLRPPPVRTAPLDDSQGMMNAPAGHEFIPAFPYFGVTGADSSNPTTEPFGMNAATFSMLDCFPEAHMDFTEWYTSPM